MTRSTRLAAATLAAFGSLVGGCSHAATPDPTRTPQPAETTNVPTPETPTVPIVRPGAFCNKEGERGVTASGTAMRCSAKPGESRPRWRAA